MTNMASAPERADIIGVCETEFFIAASVVRRRLKGPPSLCLLYKDAAAIPDYFPAAADPRNASQMSLPDVNTTPGRDMMCASASRK